LVDIYAGDERISKDRKFLIICVYPGFQIFLIGDYLGIHFFLFGFHHGQHFYFKSSWPDLISVGWQPSFLWLLPGVPSFVAFS
jgi:hypothetical protein